ncbi:MAG: hypothetical protein NVSMB22_23470 [Chloroflexota bacterium]
MGGVLPWIGFVAGIALVLINYGSMIATLVVPRSISSRIAYATWRVVLKGFRLSLKHLSTYEAKDRVLAFLSSVAVLAILATWLVLFFAGYALILWPLVNGDLSEAMRISGSSILTLGIASSSYGPAVFVTFLAAGTGLVSVALLIGYLPTIYGAYNRRETLVTLLQSRVGEPAWGPELLAREALIGNLETLDPLYAEWERLAADIAESHVNYPWLIFFRSPHPLRSWITSLLALMDSAALYLAVAPSRSPRAARAFLRMSFTALRGLADMLAIPYDPDPLPDAEILLSYDDYLAGIALMQQAGFPMERSPEEAWPHFRGWRVNYEAITYALADIVVVVPTLWSGPRTYIDDTPLAPVRPPQRTPEFPEGRDLADVVEERRRAALSASDQSR